jgi:hypothetical protein
MAVWRVLLNFSTTLIPTGSVAGVDASGLDRGHVLKRYTKRAELTIQQLKMTLLVNAKVNAIFDLHVPTTRRRESQIAPSLIRRNTETVDILHGGKGYNDRKLDDLPIDTKFAH